MRAGARFHPDQARRHIREVPNQLPARTPASRDNDPAWIEADEVKPGFADVNADCGNGFKVRALAFHEILLVLVAPFAKPCGSVGRAGLPRPPVDRVKVLSVNVIVSFQAGVRRSEATCSDLKPKPISRVGDRLSHGTAAISRATATSKYRSLQELQR